MDNGPYFNGKQKLRVGIIGIGAMGQNHMRIYADLENVDFVAVTDANEQLLEKCAKKYNLNTYTNYREMLDQEGLDLISIVVPTTLHHRVALDCIRAKVHVLIEKPISSTIEEAKELISEAKKNSVKLMIGHIERFNPAVKALKEKIQNNEVGKVYEIVVKRIGPFPVRIRDVGVVIDLSVHDIDIMRYLLECEPLRIYAETEKRIHTEHEDLLCAMMKFQNNTLCNLHINWLTPTKKRKIYVTGEKGMLTVDYLNQDLTYHENASKDILPKEDEAPFLISEGKMIKYVIEKKEPLRLELEHVVDVVLHNKIPLVSGEDGLFALEIAKKIIASANTHRVLTYAQSEEATEEYDRGSQKEQESIRI